MVYFRKFLYEYVIFYMLLFSCFAFFTAAKASTIDELTQLQRAYPDYIQSINDEFIIWDDGTKMPVGSKNRNESSSGKLDFPSLIDQLDDVSYPVGRSGNFSSFNPVGDPGRIRYEPFFLKMYGQSPNEVEKKLTTIYWMHGVFGKKYPLRITTVNSIDKKLMLISDELELLIISQPKFLKFLDDPAGAFNWRKIKNTNRLSSHSFGIAIDINNDLSNYWQWDLQRNHQPISESSKLTYKNNIPWEIVEIFEKHGFIWGGKWHHYDTMHFEYRPELLIK